MFLAFSQKWKVAGNYRWLVTSNNIFYRTHTLSNNVCTMKLCIFLKIYRRISVLSVVKKRMVCTTCWTCCTNLDYLETNKKVYNFNNMLYKPKINNVHIHSVCATKIVQTSWMVYGAVSGSWIYLKVRKSKHLLIYVKIKWKTLTTLKCGQLPNNFEKNKHFKVLCNKTKTFHNYKKKCVLIRVPYKCCAHIISLTAAVFCFFSVNSTVIFFFL